MVMIRCKDWKTELEGKHCFEVTYENRYEACVGSQD